MDNSHRVLLRDLIIFQIKLFLDGVKDIVLAPLSIVAAGVDYLLPGTERGHRFYAVMAAGERFDRWLNLFGPAQHARASTDGLFGSSDANADTLLGQLETMVAGEAERVRRAGTAQR